MVPTVIVTRPLLLDGAQGSVTASPLTRSALPTGTTGVPGSTRTPLPAAVAAIVTSTNGGRSRCGNPAPSPTLSRSTPVRGFNADASASSRPSISSRRHARNVGRSIDDPHAPSLPNQSPPGPVDTTSV